MNYLNVDTYPSMKITRVSLQSKLDDFKVDTSFILPHVLFDENNRSWMSFFHSFHTYYSMKITRVSLQSKLDELLSFFHTYYSIKITRVSLQSKLDELLSFFHTY